MQQHSKKLPEIIVFAGPNGSGKSTIIKMAKVIEPYINVVRVKSRVATGGHGVPEEKIRSRYVKSLKMIPELVHLADVMHIYDNSVLPYRIFKKRKTEYFLWENDNWDEISIRKLAGFELKN